MSRKKIVASTAIAVALGLGFATYMYADSTDEVPHPSGALAMQTGHGYRENHQRDHNGAVFAWMDAKAALNRLSTGEGRLAEHPKPAEPAASGEPEPTPIATAHYDSVASGNGGDAGGQSHSGSGGSGLYASNYSGGFGAFGGFADFGAAGTARGGGGSKNNDSNGAPGGGNPPADSQGHDAPHTGNSNPTDEHGSGEPPAQQDPPGQESQGPNPPASADQPDSGNPNPPTQTDPPPGNGDQPPPWTDDPPPGDVHEVPEPTTIGLLGLGLAAAALGRRRRR